MAELNISRTADPTDKVYGSLTATYGFLLLVFYIYYVLKMSRNAINKSFLCFLEKMADFVRNI